MIEENDSLIIMINTHYKTDHYQLICIHFWWHGILAGCLMHTGLYSYQTHSHCFQYTCMLILCLNTLNIHFLLTKYIICQINCSHHLLPYVVPPTQLVWHSYDGDTVNYIMWPLNTAENVNRAAALRHTYCFPPLFPFVANMISFM